VDVSASKRFLNLLYFLTQFGRPFFDFREAAFLEFYPMTLDFRAFLPSVFSPWLAPHFFVKARNHRAEN
jgi:hypothetical protein